MKHPTPPVLLLTTFGLLALGTANVRAERLGPFGGPVFLDLGTDMSEEQRRALQEEVDRNVAMLRAQGLLPPQSVMEDQSPPKFEIPVRASRRLKDPEVYGITYFVDQDPTAGILDYSCDDRVYDGHNGTDFVNWPFAWYKMDHDLVEVVAAASGTLVGKGDGFYDRACDCSSVDWNYVVVLHDDGSRTDYGHMKNGSVTSKGIGEPVEVGEVLGVVGSSGCSGIAHLHFAVYDAENNLVDPWAGPCNSLNASSWWRSQPPDYDSKVNHLATGFASPLFPACPQQERPYELNEFDPGDKVIFAAYYRDQLADQVSTFTVYDPNGAVYDTWTHSSPLAYSDVSFWTWQDTNFAPTGPFGIWRFTVEYEGVTTEHLFRLSPSVGVGRVPGQLGEPDLLEVAKSGSQITLTWPASCVATDTDYEVYEGAIGTWYSHESRICNTGGTSATFDPDAGNTYYLVVPTDGTSEGTYGYDGLLAERPQGDPFCRPQAIGGHCPRCGDDVLESPEICDNFDTGGETCQSQGFTGGTLLCNATCDGYDTRLCF